MEASRLDRVHVEVAETLVEITWDERDMLLNKLRDLAGCGTIIERFWAAGASRPVEFDDEQRSHLRTALDVWDDADELPGGDGIARLHIALVQADPGGSVGSASSFDG